MPKSRTKQNQRSQKTRRRKRPNRSKAARIHEASHLVGSSIGAMSGNYLGGPLGRLAGGYVGGEAGDWLGKIIGNGDYKVSNNSLVGTSVPRFGSSRTRVRHSEFITDVISPGPNFTNNSYPVNPGNALLFPWLSQMADLYECWEPKGIVFTYKSTSGTAVGSTNTALGSVIMATSYDVLDPKFASKREMEAYEFSVSTATCTNSIHPIECKPSMNPLDVLYVSDSTSVAGVDARFHDLGRFQIATKGQQAAVTAGELWVTYDIVFSKPKLGSKIAGVAASAHFTCTPITADPGLLLDAVKHSGSSNYIHHTNDGVNLKLSKPGRYMVIKTMETTGGGISAASSFIAGTDSVEVEDFMRHLPLTGALNVLGAAKGAVIGLFDCNPPIGGTALISIGSFTFTGTDEGTFVIVAEISAGLQQPFSRFAELNPFGLPPLADLERFYLENGGGSRQFDDDHKQGFSPLSDHCTRLYADDEYETGFRTTPMEIIPPALPTEPRRRSTPGVRQ